MLAALAGLGMIGAASAAGRQHKLGGLSFSPTEHKKRFDIFLRDAKDHLATAKRTGDKKKALAATYLYGRAKENMISSQLVMEDKDYDDLQKLMKDIQNFFKVT